MEQDVPQCGYCQSGQIMQAIALLRNSRKTVAGVVTSRTTPQDGCALGAPPEELRSSFAVWWRASAPFALLESRRNPTDTEIDEVMSSNVCRCGTYQRIRAAIKAAATGEAE